MDPVVCAKPVFARKCSFQVCSVFILATKGYKVGLGEIRGGARKLKKPATGSTGY